MQKYERVNVITVIAMLIACFLLAIFITCFFCQSENESVYAEGSIIPYGTYTYGATYENLIANLKENGEEGGYYEIDSKYFSSDKELINGGQIGLQQFDARFYAKDADNNTYVNVVIEIIIEKRTPLINGTIPQDYVLNEKDIVITLPDKTNAVYGDNASVIASQITDSHFSVALPNQKVGNAGLNRTIPIVYTPDDLEHYNVLSGTFIEINEDLVVNANCNIKVDVAKANYDMSEVEFNDTTKYFYLGDIISTEISGSLPEGVTVLYLNNTITSEGEHCVTAIFNGDYNNYNQIKSMDATVKTVLIGYIRENKNAKVEVTSVNEHESISDLVNVDLTYTTESLENERIRYILEIRNRGVSNGEYYFLFTLTDFSIDGDTIRIYRLDNNVEMDITDFEMIANNQYRIKSSVFGIFVFEGVYEEQSEATNPTQPLDYKLIIGLSVSGGVLLIVAIILVVIFVSTQKKDKKYSPTTPSSPSSQTLPANNKDGEGKEEEKIQKITSQVSKNKKKGSNKKRQKISSKKEYLGKKKK